MNLELSSEEGGLVLCVGGGLFRGLRRAAPAIRRRAALPDGIFPP